MPGSARGGRERKDGETEVGRECSGQEEGRSGLEEGQDKLWQY